MIVDVPPKVKKQAHAMVAAAIQSNVLRRLPCVVCGSTSHVDGHHPDYGKPLDVQWLCRSHHLMMHRNAEFAAGWDGHEVKGFDISRFGLLCPESRYDNRRARRADGSYVSDAEKAVNLIERKNRLIKHSLNREKRERRSSKLEAMRASGRSVELMKVAKNKIETADAREIWATVWKYGALQPKLESTG